MRELKDYAPFYLGCKVIGTYDNKPRKGYLTGVNNGGYDCEIQFFEEDGINVFEHPVFNTIDEIKLTLRPLPDMTKEEKIEMVLLFDDQFVLGQEGKYAWRATFFPSMFEYLLSKHFDLFGLIEAGLAIDKTTLKQS